MKSVAGTWSGVGQWCPPGSLPYVFFPTLFFMEDGSSILQLSSSMDEYGPYTYRCNLHNGKLFTVNGEYTLYERDGKRVLVYRTHAGYTTAELEFISANNALPKRKNFCNDCFYDSPITIY